MIMAGLAGKKRVRVNKTVHMGDKTTQECREHEAFLLELSNTKLEGMKPEEIFKAQEGDIIKAKSNKIRAIYVKDNKLLNPTNWE